MMKKKKIIFGSLAVAIAASAILVACNKNLNKSSDRSLRAGVAEACECGVSGTTDSTISTDITTNWHLSANKIYHLQGVIFVTNSSTLEIEAGTVIKGTKGVGGNPGGGLVITRNSKIYADGTSNCPIVFTSGESSPASGDWSGVIVLGNARTNNFPAMIEGVNNTLFPGRDLVYGNNTSANNTESSGRLTFVRIEYAGFELTENNEINGLTFGGVGSGTLVDYVEVFKSNDDAFEFFGGTVNASHLLAIDALDDMFDTDNGYSGTITYALGLADQTRKDQSQSNGLENDNNGTGDSTAFPHTHPHYNFLTIVGVDGGVAASSTGIDSKGRTTSYGRGGQMRRSGEFTIDHAIIFGYNYGLTLDTALGNTRSTFYGYGTPKVSFLTNSFVSGYGTSVANVGAYAHESNGIPFNGTRFNSILDFDFYANGTGNTESGKAVSNNPFSLNNPYDRTGSNCAENYMTDPFSAAAGSGAFPDGDWTIVNGCCKWTRYQ